MPRKIEIPFAYEAMAVPRRSSSARTYRVVDTIMAEIPELDMSDLALAGRLVGPSSAVEFRMHGAHFVTPHRRGLKLENLGLAVERLGAFVEQNHFPSLKYAALDARLNTVPGDILFSTPSVWARDLAVTVREVKSSQEDEARARMLDDVIPRLCIVDGRLHCAEDEPVWSVGMKENDQGERSLAATSLLTSHGNLPRSHCFRVDRLDSALAFGCIPEERAPDFHFEDAGVHDWSFDEISHASRLLAGALDAMMQRLHFGSVSGNSLAFFDAYCKLRDWQAHDLQSRQEAVGAFEAGLPNAPHHKDFREEILPALQKWRWIVADSAQARMDADLKGFAA